MNRIVLFLFTTAGLAYGGLAVGTVYRDVPLGLQAFIVGGVALLGFGVGFLVDAVVFRVWRRLLRGQGSFDSISSG